MTIIIKLSSRTLRIDSTLLIGNFPSIYLVTSLSVIGGQLCLYTLTSSDDEESNVSEPYIIKLDIIIIISVNQTRIEKKQKILFKAMKNLKTNIFTFILKGNIKHTHTTFFM